ncbi:DUF389 domain-containing protein [Altericroceibacterium xinjiangense]|uniref:DUF389 domain-containing protein n=1 Tax=Altericroceibacterium xinjiangense TaxID=762261 RepID=UPI000F7E2EC4|nr:DUF389 domain-containing protein [Altericroceibacterium xinjiangense]
MATLSDPTPYEEKGNGTEAEAPSSSDTHVHLLATIRDWWRRSIVSGIDQPSVIEKLHVESSMSARYVFMACMSAGIAILGLLLSSPAVVIGAMLLAPFMGPLLGAGFALAVGDFDWLKTCVRNLFIGIGFALIVCILIVLASPLDTVTEEMASRTKPNLFDLLVALFASLAGSYAMIRGREGTIVGVAIATALMPPLAVVGFGAATLNRTVFSGSLMLLVTNLVTIALSAFVMARYYGFRTNLSERQSLLQSIGIAAAFIALAVPLGISLIEIAWEANASRSINGVIKDQFGEDARISQIDIDYEAEPVQVSATVLTPEFRPQAQALAERSLSRLLGRPLVVEIDQFRVSTDPRAAEAAQLARAREAEQAETTERQIDELSARLGLVAGVERENVTIDRENRRALVDAQPIEGTTLAGYRALEQRITGTMPGWTIRMRPPTRPLPTVRFEGGNLTPEGREAASLIAWAAARTGTPVGLSGPAGAVEQLAQLLERQGVTVRIVEVEEQEVPDDGGAAEDGEIPDAVVVPNWVLELG